MAWLILVTFLTSTVFPPASMAEVILAPAPNSLNLPPAGLMVSRSESFAPVMLKGLKVDPQNPLRFDFIIDPGDSGLKGEALKKEGERLIKYFLAALTVKGEDLWVNLSPYEKDRVIPEGFGATEMGRDLLAQDYLLKQLTASLIYPEEGLGRKFWAQVYENAYRQYQTTDIPINTFNKVWIIPDKAVIYSKDQAAYIVDSYLRVMLEQDYLALEKNLKKKELGTDQLKKEDVEKINEISASMVRKMVLPEVEKEINRGKNFSQLRQIYDAVILATWFKRHLREGILKKVYVGKDKIAGVDVDDKTDREKIYQQYLDAFKKGVYNYYRDDFDPFMQKQVSRNYFSGGAEMREEVVEQVSREVDDGRALPLDGRQISLKTDLTRVQSSLAATVLAGGRGEDRQRGPDEAVLVDSVGAVAGAEGREEDSRDIDEEFERYLE
ncbi:MAG: hypothetical protein NUV91_04735, partial [Candidatus Omnitrophica bacterium]|nr:hypothetical protein [Candidatus Omnitrophota bacterium]